MSLLYRKRLGALLLLALTGLWACSDSPTEPPADPTPSEIDLSPTDLNLNGLGLTEQITATVYDEDGDEIPDASVSWSSSDDEVASVTDSGVVESIGPGTATITAQSGDVTAETEVVVTNDEEEEEEEEEEE